MAEPGDVTLTLNYAEIGLFLRTNPELRAHLEDLGRRGVAYARSIAPVGTRDTKYTRPGQYRDSIVYEVVEGRHRMQLRIFSTDFTAWWQEYGSKKVPRRAVLRRTLDYLTSGQTFDASRYAGVAEYDAHNRRTQKSRGRRRAGRAALARIRG